MSAAAAYTIADAPVDGTKRYRYDLVVAYSTKTPASARPDTAYTAAVVLSDAEPTRAHIPLVVFVPLDA